MKATIRYSAFYSPLHPAGELVFEVAAKGQEVAELVFQATNAPFPTPEAVVVSRDGFCASLSVGDFVELEDGQCFLCLGAGWEPLSKEHMDNLREFQVSFAKNNQESYWDMARQGVSRLRLLRIRDSRIADRAA